jgi:hypothetical protein
VAPPFDPVLGLTGTLNAVQTQAPMAPNAVPQDNSASQHLERAARSLESVQGNVSGQTQAIQQMSMIAQQQSAMMSMLINQLSMQVAGLSQAIGGMSTAMRMGPAMTQMAYPMAPTDMGGGGGGGGGGGFLRRAGGAAVTGGSAAFGGLYSAGRPFGAFGGGLVSPFFGTPVGAPGPGQIGPQMSQDVGLWRSAVMASGFGIDPRMMRTAGGGQLQQLGRERLQQNVADVGLGLTGGAARVGIGYGAGELGMAIGGRLGLGMVGGGIAGMALGGALAAPASMAIDEIMRQSAAQRGYGEQFGRNAFRMLGPQQTSGFGALRRPGMQDRLRFGQAVNRMEIQDLTMTQQDMTEAFAGMSQNDLARGVRNVDEVVQRFRETKETLKLLGRRMGQGIQEAAGTMGALQAIGIDPTGQRGRAAIFGASSILGMTPSEAMQRSMGMAGTQWGAQGGFGAGMLGVGQVSLQAGQSAIQRGALNASQIAALGGREGTGEALQTMVSNFLQSGVGRAMLVAGPQAMGAGVQETMRMASQRASIDRGRVVDVQMGGQKQTQEYLKDPNRAVADIYAKIRDLSVMYSQNDPTIGRERAMRMALSQFMPGSNDAQLDAILTTMKNLPQAIRDDQRQKAVNLGDELSSVQLQNLALTARAGRFMRGAMTPIAEGLTGAWTGFSEDVGAGVTGIYNAAIGAEEVTVGGRIDPKTLSAMRKRGGQGDIYAPEALNTNIAVGGTVGASSGLRELGEASNRIRDEQRSIMTEGAVDSSRKRKIRKQITRANDGANYEKIAKLKERIATGEPDQKQRAAEELMQIYGGEEYKKAKADMNSKDPDVRKRALETMRTYQEAVGSSLGEDMNTLLLGKSARTGLSGVERQRMETEETNITEFLRLGKGANLDAFTMPEMEAYINKLAAGEEGIDELVALRKAGAERGIDVAPAVEQIKLRAFGEGQGYFTGGVRGMKKLQEMVSGKEGKGGFKELRSREQVETQSKVLGEGFAESLRAAKLGRGDIEARLKKGGMQERIAAFGELQSTLKDKDIEKLQGTALGDILNQLKGIEGDIDTPEERAIARKALEGRVRKEEMESALDSVSQPGGVGELMTLMGAGEGPSMKVLTKRGEGLSGEQALSIAKFMEQTNQLALVVRELKYGPGSTKPRKPGD